MAESPTWAKIIGEVLEAWHTAADVDLDEITPGEMVRLQVTIEQLLDLGVDSQRI